MSTLRGQRPYLTSLSWSALKDAGVPFTPNYMRWGHPFELALDGDAGIVFFVDLEAIGAYLRSKVGALGLAASLDSEEPLMRVSDSRFEARVGLHALVAEALWTACGPLTVVNNRTRQLPGDFRGYAALHDSGEESVVSKGMARCTDASTKGLRFCRHARTRGTTSPCSQTSR